MSDCVVILSNGTSSWTLVICDISLFKLRESNFRNLGGGMFLSVHFKGSG